MWTGMKRVLVVSMVVSLAGLAGGCGMGSSGLEAGEGIGYTGGSSVVILEARPKPVLKAARQVYRQMEIEVDYSRRNGERRRLSGSTRNNDPVKTTVLAVDAGTKMWVRVGMFGDRELSDEIARRIRDRLASKSANAKK